MSLAKHVFHMLHSFVYFLYCVICNVNDDKVMKKKTLSLKEMEVALQSHQSSHANFFCTAFARDIQQLQKKKKTTTVT